MDYKTLRATLLLPIMLAGSAMAYAVDGDPLLQRVRSEYPPAVKRLEVVYGRVRGSGNSKVTIPLPPASERTIVADFSFAFDGDSRRFVRHFTDTSPARTGSRDDVYCINKKYSFSLSRDESDKPYLLTGFEKEGQTSVIETIMTLSGNYIDAPFMLDDMPISRLMASPGFQFSKATGLSEGGRDLVKIEFDCPNPDRSPKPKPWVYAGSMIVTPSESWCLQRAEYFYHPSLKRAFKTTIEYGTPIGGIPVPKSVTVAQPDKLTRAWVFDQVSFAATSESEFALTAFGLPDILSRPGSDQSTSHMGSWLVGLAILGMLAAVAMRYLAARAEKRNSALNSG